MANVRSVGLITMLRYRPCIDCVGLGYVSREVPATVDFIAKKLKISTACARCKGKGWIADETV